MQESVSGESGRTATAAGNAARVPQQARRYALRLAAGVVVIALVAVAGDMLLKRRARAFDMPPRPFGGAGAGDESAEPRLRRPAPTENEDRDAGVAEAARQFAIELVTASLKRPESAEVPVDEIRFERVDQLNQVTDGKIEHWLVDGAVDSRNDYGYMVRSHWRVVLGRNDDDFFPIIAALEGFAIFHLRDHSDLVRDARQLALQERQAEAAAKKAQDLADRSAVWQAIDAAKPAEAKAQAALKMALNLLAAGKVEAAYDRLQELLEKFPDTNAAAEARELLEK